VYNIVSSLEALYMKVLKLVHATVDSGIIYDFGEDCQSSAILH
jgi:hypothetical protein